MDCVTTSFLIWEERDIRPDYLSAKDSVSLRQGLRRQRYSSGIQSAHATYTSSQHNSCLSFLTVHMFKSFLSILFEVISL